MWSAKSLFFLLWIGFAWMLLTSSSDVPTATRIQIQHSPSKQNCSAKEIKCVNDCSFLCVEKESRCVGGICVVEQNKLNCNSKKGGMTILTNDPVNHWTCLCTDSSFWSGKNCDVLNPDVCEHGVFLYEGRNDFTCLCPYPYQMITVNGKPHCVEKHVANFFPDSLGRQVEPCPAWRNDCNDGQPINV